MAIRGAWLRIATAGAIATIALQCSTAVAQQSVGLDPQGIGLGGFRLYPDVKITTYYDDNVFLSTTDPRSDTGELIVPTVALRSTWSVHQLQLDGTSTLRRFNNNPQQNTNEYEGGANGRLDYDSRTPISASIRGGRRAEIRGAPGDENSLGRYRLYDFVEATFGVSHGFNRLTLSANGSLRNFRYGPITVAGQSFDQRQLDRNARSLTGAVQYALSNITVPYVSLTRSTIRFPNPGTTPTRDSTGTSILFGTSFEITRLFYGRIAVGYLKQKFKNPEYLDFSGLNFDADITYKPTTLDTLHFTATRSIVNSAFLGVPGVLQSNFTFDIVHDLTPRMAILGNVIYNRELYRGIDRRQDRYTASIAVRRKVNRYLAASLSYQRLQLKSYGIAEGQDYIGNRVSVSLTAFK